MRPAVWLPALSLLALPLSGQKPAATARRPAVVLASAHAEPAATVEAVVARVNNSIITTDDLQHAEQQLQSDLQNASPAVPPQQAAQQRKDLLRDLIDQQLLLQKASDLGLSAETETVRQMDQIRRSLNLPTMEDLQKAVEAQGEDYEDFKQNIANGILQRMVIEQDVAPRIDIAPEEEEKYYNAHKAEFITQDEVRLSEILVSIQDKPANDRARLKQLATEIQVRAVRGEDFGKLAQRYSNGSTASTGGDIGTFKKGTLTPALEKVVFALSPGGVTPVMDIPGGYLILEVTARHHAGQETLDEARSAIEQRLYEAKLQPELQHYLARLRSAAYINVKPGYVDTGASDTEGVNLERFERVLPQDLPKPTDKSSSSSDSSGSQ